VVWLINRLFWRIRYFSWPIYRKCKQPYKNKGNPILRCSC